MPKFFELAQRYFNDFLQEFAAYGIQAAPTLELRQGQGLAFYYNLEDGHIYVALPELDDPLGKLHLVLLRQLLGLQSQAEVLLLLELFLPYIIAHELGHHFRHHYGLFRDDNLWHEEQVANQLAMAVTKPRLNPGLKAAARRLLPRVLDFLATKLQVNNAATDSYHNMLSAMNASGQIGDGAADDLALVQKLFALDPTEALKESGLLAPEMLARLDQREAVIDTINEEYASNFMRYVYYHIGWLQLALTTRENHYVDEFVREHLNQRLALLPVPPALPDPSEAAIVACYKAYRQSRAANSETAARYFYKRYRSMLLTKLATVVPAGTSANGFTKGANWLLESWSDGDTDTLAYLAPLVPPTWRALFPQAIASQLDTKLAMQVHLPAEADVRLWKHVFLKEPDLGAANTLARLALLDQTDLYHSLPAEVLLELTHSLCRMKMRGGDTIIWEQDANDDVYILVHGELEAVVKQGGGQMRVGVIRAGEVFGEMAFFTRAPRKATVRATMAAECFVLKDADLRLFAYKHPVILMQMARVLARRVAQLNRQTSATHRQATPAK